MYYLTSFLILIYWLLILSVLYTFFGYPLLLGAISLFKKKAKQERPEYLPKVSLVIIAGNDEKTIKAKLENTSHFEYPKEKLEIIVAAVASTDNTRRIVEDHFSKGVKLLYQADKAGRNLAINACVAEAGGEVIIFTDASSMIEKFSIKNIARHFADIKVGLVAGNIDFSPGKDPLVSGERLFVEHNRLVLLNSAKLKQFSRVNPELYAIRKSGFHELRDDGVPDYTLVPVMYSVSGMVCLYEPLALAVKTKNISRDDFFAEKVASTIEALRSEKYLAELLHSKKYLTLIQLISHNILYGVYGGLLFLLFLFNLLVLVKPGYVVLLSLQFLFYVAGALKLFGFFPNYVLLTAYAHITGIVKIIKKGAADGKG